MNESMEIYPYDRPAKYLRHLTGIYPYREHPYYNLQRYKQGDAYFKELRVFNNRVQGVQNK